MNNSSPLPLGTISLADIPKILHLLSAEEQAQLLAELDHLADLKLKEEATAHFMPFVKAMWPGFIEGRHHIKMADAFERVVAGTLKRLIICMPPRHTKSEFGSYLLPAWFLGKLPDKKVIQASNTADLAVGFGRKVRNLVATERYQKVFPSTELRADSKAAGRWNTSKDGEYFAIGVGGTVTGKGADIFIIDDPHSEQQAKLAESDPAIYDGVYEWYTSGPRQRLQPGGAIIIIMTRWSKRDLVGKVLSAAAIRGGSMPESEDDDNENTDSDADDDESGDDVVELDHEDWEVIEFPAILPSGKPVWPEFWPLKELEALRTELPHAKWSSQYQQNPVAESSAIIKREWFQIWDKKRPPRCEFILQSWDTAFEKHERADYSALTQWGVFYKESRDTGLRETNLILLNAFRDRLEFPQLKREALKQYKEWEPDSVIIEKKASGAPLIYELRSMGIPVQEFSPTRATGDKIARLNAVSDIIASKRVWVPNTHWAEEVIQEIIDFPAGMHDDYVDSSVMALMRFRNGGFIGTALDEPEEEEYQGRRNRGYY